MRFRAIIAALLLLNQGAFGGPTATSEPYKTGDAFAPIVGTDQHGRPHGTGTGIVLVLVSFEKGTGTEVNDYLEKKPEGLLEQAGIVYIADMHAMPRFVKRFVYPSLKKLPHRILLNESETALERIPRESARITVIRIDAEGNVASLDFIDPEKDLERLFAPKP